MMDGYWKLYAKIFGIPICRKCGAVMDVDYKKRRRGKLCLLCYVNEALDIDTV